jgi:NitT/TauT family transport system substrate-binding protein
VAPAEVQFVGVGTSAAAAAALQEGRIDAIANIDPVISLLEFRGDIRVVADTRSLRGTQELYGGPMPGSCVYAPQALVLRYPQTVQALANAVVRALKWLQTAGPSDIVRAVPESSMHGDRAIYLAALEKAREALSPDGVLSDEAVATAHRVVAQYATGGTPVRLQAPGATYTNEFVRRARLRPQVSGAGRGRVAA